VTKSAVFRSHDRVLANFRLVGFERTEADDPCAHAAQFGDVVPERLVRPSGSTFPQGRTRLPVFTAGEERQLKSNGAALVTGVPVLARFGRVSPPIRRQQSCNLVVVFHPYSEVDVVVRSRYRARVKVDCPATEQPVLDSVPFEDVLNVGQGV
jgi:hypothetical protein